MKLPDFEYLAPSTPREVVAALASRPAEAKILAGGQSLLPAMAFRLARPGLLVDLRNCAGLDTIAIEPRGVRLGARTRWRDIENDTGLATAHPLLVAAVRHVAHYPIRNRGTIGGSLAHADPAAEIPCVAVTCGAELRVLGPAGERRIAASSFFLGPLATALAADELILEVSFPAWPRDRRWAFREFSRRAGDFALAGIALHYDNATDGRVRDLRVGVFGAAHQPQRLARAEAALEGLTITAERARAAAEIAAGEVDPPGDTHAGAAYRRSLVATLLEQCLIEAQERS